MTQSPILVPDLISPSAITRLTPRQIVLTFAAANDYNGITGVAELLGTSRQVLNRCLRHYDPDADSVDTRPLSYGLAARLEQLIGWAPADLQRASDRRRRQVA